MSRARKLDPLDPSTARVAIVLPVRNEADFVDGALDSVLRQTFDHRRMEVLVIDGCSEDQTAQVASEALESRLDPNSTMRPRSRVLLNPSRTIPSGMNVGIAATTADVIVRVDAHCRLAPDYVEACVRLLAESGAANVGGPMRPRGTGPVGEAMTIALCSKFGIGDSSFHFGDQQEPAETVYLGAFRRSVLEEVGGFDESLLSNEDFELNHRLRQRGFAVLLSPAIRSIYLPRSTVPDIARQFFRYGTWKARVMRKHPESVRLRHLVPPLLVGSICFTLSLFLRTRRRTLLIPVGIYAAAIAVASWLEAAPKRRALALLAVFPAMHLSWGAGVLTGLLRSAPPRSPDRPVEDLYRA